MSTIYSSGLAAVLASAADKITYLQAIIDALGATRAVKFKKFTTPPSDWSSSTQWDALTTIYAAPVTGAMGISNGALTNIGTVGPHTVRANADLSTGFAIMRMEGNGAWMQGTVGLAGATGFDDQPVDFVLRKSPNGAYGIVLNSAKFGAPAHLAAAPDAELSLARMWNTGGAQEPAGFVSPFFGCSFAQGAIPAGTYPYFRVAGGGAVCPATLWSTTLWPDGSMKFCGAMVRVPVAVSASSYVDISVRSGGDAPVAGTRTTGDLTAADINVQMVGVDGLTGTWTATLNDAIATGAAVEKLGDGPAGALWRIGGEVRDSSSAAHGQMYCWHYVAALTNADGSFRGSRYLGRVAQPWIDVTTPAPRHRDLQATLRRGATTIRTLQGHTDSETPGNVIRLPHFASFFTAGSDGKWDYIQGGGSSAADAAIRVTVNATHAIESRVIPPFDLSVPGITFTSKDYVPMGRGTYEARAMSGTADKPEIGIWTQWNVTHLADQSVLNERIVRVNAMLGGSWRIAQRRKTTGMPALYSPMPKSYPGLGALNTPSPAAVSPNLSLWVEDDAHFPNPFSWAYAFTAEPQYLDLIQERGGKVQDTNAGTKVLNITFPRTNSQTSFAGVRNIQMGTGGPVFPGCGNLFQYGGRIAAWALRDIGHAASFTPEGPYKEYLTDVLASNFAAFRFYGESQPESYRNSGLFILQNSDGAVTGYESPWMTGYLGTVVCAINDMIPNIDAGYMQSYLSRFWTAHAQEMDIGSAIAYRHSAWDGDGQLIASAAGSLFTSGVATMSFTAADSRGTINNAAWSPNNGDVYAFCVGAFSSAYPFPQATFNKRFYAVNCSGKTLQLAATPGGSPITVPADVNCGLFLVQSKNLTPDVYIHNTDWTDFFQIPYGSIAYFARKGEPGAATLFDSIKARTLAKGWAPTDKTKFSFLKA